MGQGVNRGSIQISGRALLLGALILLVLPLPWLLAAAAAAVWHELCHVLAVKLCGSSVRRVQVGSVGTVLECGNLPPGRELLCSLAGPVGSLLLLVFVRYLPRIAVCGLVQGIYNLLPFYPLDGGRALYSGLRSLMAQEKAQLYCARIELAVRSLITLAAVVTALVWKLGILPILMAALLLFRVKREKLLANCRGRGYNSHTIIKR